MQDKAEWECKECAGTLWRIGSFYACATPECSRYATPVNDRGDDENEVSNYEEPSAQGDGCFYSSDRMAALQREIL